MIHLPDKPVGQITGALFIVKRKCYNPGYLNVAVGDVVQKKRIFSANAVIAYMPRTNKDDKFLGRLFAASECATCALAMSRSAVVNMTTL